MIISDNKTNSLSEFKKLIEKMDEFLNADAKINEDYYTTRSGTLLEIDVHTALCKVSKGTPFEGTIRLVSGSSFPDIIANKYFGIEVKSTTQNHWTSIGSSILESTRDANVERIFLTFGKLGRPVQFLTRPYEDCLTGIVVTHYPRYQIDMRLKAGETVFDKMGIAYDTLRKMKNPVSPVADYYRKQLKPGESLWWTSDNIDAPAPAKVSLWSTLSQKEKDTLSAQGIALFPEMLSSSNKKYNRYALWLVTNKSIVNTNIRDSFSAGGQMSISLTEGIQVLSPRIFKNIQDWSHLIAAFILNESENELKEHWSVDKIDENRISQWCDLAAKYSDTSIGYFQALNILKSIFASYI